MSAAVAKSLFRHGCLCVRQGLGAVAQRYELSSVRGSLSAHCYCSSSINDDKRRKHTSQTLSAEEVRDSSISVSFTDIDTIDSPLTPHQWSTMKTTAKHPESFERKAMERLHSNPNFSVPESLVKYIEGEGRKPRYGVLFAYLRICVKHGMYDEMFKVFAELRRTGKMLDPDLLSILIRGFCRTNRWKDSLEFLKVAKALGQVYNNHYNPIIIAALQHGEKQLGLSLYEEMVSAGLTPNDECCGAAIRTLTLPEDEDWVYSLFEKMRRKAEFPSLSLAGHIKEWFEGKKTEKWTGTFTSIHASGHCKTCGTRLEGIDLTDEEFQLLHASVLRRVIHGKDIFRSTTPEELRKFLNFMEDHHNYDIVLDGLNVAYSMGSKQKQYSRTLLKVVEHLVMQLRQRVLVLGRKHMKKNLSANGAWRRTDIAAIESLADFFLTDDVSRDDPYLLYATLSCGPRACFISRDFMRDHYALLDQSVQQLFLKWLRGHQIKILRLTHGAPIFSKVHTFDTVVQRTQNIWHFPCEDVVPRQGLEVPDRWLCIQRAN